MKKMIFISAVLLLPLAFSGVWLSKRNSPANQLSASQFDAHRLLEFQTDDHPCLAEPFLQAESRIPRNQIFFDEQQTIEVTTGYVGPGKMQDLFYRYPCPSGVPDGLSIHPGK